MVPLSSGWLQDLLDIAEDERVELARDEGDLPEGLTEEEEREYVRSQLF